MRKEDYPALYIAADTASKKSQKWYLGCIIAYVLLLVVSSMFSQFIELSDINAIISLICILIIIAISFLLAIMKFQKVWYSARALAESIKTRTWRYIMRSEPYEDATNLQIVKKRFCSDLSTILQQNREMVHKLDVGMTGESITKNMNLIRAKDLRERIDYYIENRIKDQRTWYAKRTSSNKGNANIWFTIMIILYSVAIIGLILKIYCNGLNSFPIEPLIVAGSATLIWIQTKKYNELASSYTFTAHEIGIINTMSDYVKTEDDFSNFVKDSENAFSREHTQWFARRDE